MPEEILLIVENGTIAVLGDTAKARDLFGAYVGTVQQRRASHVEPINPALRLAFRALRWLGGDKGRVAAFTRSWGCQWRVDLAPSGGGILEPFAARADAIAAEIEWLCINL